VAEQASERINVDAPPARCYAVAIDFERYPDWARDVKQATVLTRDDEGRGAQVEYRAAGLGKSFRYTLEYDYTEAPESFSWRLVEGDMLRRLDGTYRFEADGDGTRVHYDLTVDLSAPLPGLIKRRAAGMIMGTALRELKKEIERSAG
jgi:ribosome-associated toxin RatA of RatAB toxin-antitoxin module